FRPRVHPVALKPSRSLGTRSRPVHREMDPARAMNRLRLLQACNVGQIVGGTTACAWTITRALPEFEHVVAFLTEISPETRAAFACAQLQHWRRCIPEVVDSTRADVVILHNIIGRRRMS